VLIVLVSQLVISGHKPGARDARTEESRILERIQPVGNVVVADPSAAGKLTGMQVFDQVCKTCHEAGIAGAPKVGDKAAWGPRLAQGDKVLFAHAIAGFQGKSGVMPPKGGNSDLADVEVDRAVVYMANQSGGNLKEPAAPAPGAQAAAGTGQTPGAAQPAAATSQASTAASAAAPAAAMVAAATVMATPAAAAAPAAGAKPDGKKVFDQTCNVCHGAGIVGAPKFGDKAAWAPRIAQGTSVLYQHALQGFQGKSGVMPPKGGNTALGDADVKAAVDYMAAAAK
jgi:cytochrome c5